VTTGKTNPAAFREKPWVIHVIFTPKFRASWKTKTKHGWETFLGTLMVDEEGKREKLLLP